MTTTRREHDLLLCIARRDLDERRQTELRRLLSAALDWPYLMSAARRHGLMPLLYRHLNGISKEVPSTYFAAIKQESIENCQAVLTLLGRLTAVLKLFNQQNLPVLVFKGPVLADIAYGDNSFRQAGDIDVLVARENFGRAKYLLKSLGYEMVPALTAAQQAAHLNFHCEIPFLRDNGFTVIDLHWSLAPKAFPFGLDSEKVFARSRELSISGQRYRTFGVEDLIVFQCMHGGKHYWSRLEWITSLAELFQREREIDWEQVVQLARTTHSLKMLALALNLVAQVSDVQIPTDIPEMKAMQQVAVEMLATIFSEHEPEYSSARGMRKNFQILDRKRDAFASMLRVMFVPTLSDWQSLSLPTSLQPLYYIYRPLRLLGTYGASLMRRMFSDSRPQTRIKSVNEPLTGGLIE
ncbi:MAG TPA: nucleotidyltransferase family protein [Pyrinomonadaceae bacterium]